MRYSLATCLALLLLASGLPGAPFAAPTRAPAERLQTGIFLVLDHATGAVVRKRYAVWDAAPERNLAFEWIADVPSATDAELVSGTGRLIWREHGRPSFGARAIVRTYRGAMTLGRAHGWGELRTREGLHYEGEWRAGVYHGRGALQRADGTSYTGSFRAGAFDGEGTLVDAANETFTGPFVAGRKHGSGRTRLASGASYWSTWAQGREVADSRFVRLAQAGPPAAAGVQLAPDDVQFAFRVDRAPEGSLEAFMVLGYAGRNLPDKIEIVPDNKALMSAWKRKGLLSEPFIRRDVEYRSIPLNVQIKAPSQNVDIRNAFVEVDESETDLQPLLQMVYWSPLTADRGCASPRHFESKVVFENYGLGPPRTFGLSAAYARTAGGAAVERSTVSIDPKSLTGGQIAFDFEPELARLGVNTRQLRSWSRQLDEYPNGDGKTGNPSRRDEIDAALGCKGMDDAVCLAKIKSTNVFGKLAPAVTIKDGIFAVDVAGRAAYSWADAKGAVRESEGTFAIRMTLGARRFASYAECGAERPDEDPAGATYVDFKLDQAAYRVNVPFKRALKAGQTARLKLLLRTQKSSRHRFRVVLETTDGRIIKSKNIDVQVFVSALWKEPPTYPVPAGP